MKGTKYYLCILTLLLGVASLSASATLEARMSPGTEKTLRQDSSTVASTPSEEEIARYQNPDFSQMAQKIILKYQELLKEWKRTTFRLFRNNEEFFTEEAYVRVFDPVNEAGIRGFTVSELSRHASTNLLENKEIRSILLRKFNKRKPDENVPILSHVLASIYQKYKDRILSMYDIKEVGDTTIIGLDDVTFWYENHILKGIESEREVSVNGLSNPFNSFKEDWVKEYFKKNQSKFDYELIMCWINNYGMRGGLNTFSLLFDSKIGSHKLRYNNNSQTEPTFELIDFDWKQFIDFAEIPYGSSPEEFAWLSVYKGLDTSVLLKEKRKSEFNIRDLGNDIEVVTENGKKYKLVYATFTQYWGPNANYQDRLSYGDEGYAPEEVFEAQGEYFSYALAKDRKAIADAKKKEQEKERAYLQKLVKKCRANDYIGLSNFDIVKLMEEGYITHAVQGSTELIFTFTNKWGKRRTVYLRRGFVNTTVVSQR